MYEYYERLRDEMGISNYKVSKATGISQVTLSEWKLGKSVPSRKTIEKLASFFGVPMEYFTTGEQPKYYTNEETAQIAEEIFHNKDMRILFEATKGAKPEDLQFLAEMAKRMKATNPDG